MKGSGKTRHAKSWPSPQLAAGPAHVTGCSLLLQLVSMIREITLVAIDHVTDDNNFEISCGNVSVECVDRTLFPQRLYPTLTFSFITILQRPIFSFPFLNPKELKRVSRRLRSPLLIWNGCSKTIA